PAAGGEDAVLGGGGGVRAVVGRLLVRRGAAGGEVHGARQVGSVPGGALLMGFLGGVELRRGPLGLGGPSRPVGGGVVVVVRAGAGPRVNDGAACGGQGSASRRSGVAAACAGSWAAAAAVG